jgi:predicted ATPase
MLRSVRIQNTRSCRDTRMDLGRPVTALVGRNGVGKTNIIQTIGWIVQSATRASPIQWHEVHQTQPEESAVQLTLDVGATAYDYILSIPPLWPHSGGRTAVEIREYLRLLPSDGGDVITLLERSGEEVRVRDLSSPIRVGASTPAIGALSSLLPDGTPLGMHLRCLSDSMQTVSYYGLESPGEYRQTLLRERDYRDWRLTHFPTGPVSNSVSMRLLYMYREDRAMLQEFLDLLGEKGLGLLADFKIHEMQFPGVTPPTEKNGSEVDTVYVPFFIPARGIGGTGRSFGLDSLSAGTQRIIQMAVALLFDRRTTMMVEQPEDCIHPGLLRKLLDLFRSYSDRTQIVFSTHSPAVLDMLKPEEILLVTAPEGNTEVRGLSPHEMSVARQFLQEEGALSEFYETLDEP